MPPGPIIYTVHYLSVIHDSRLYEKYRQEYYKLQSRYHFPGDYNTNRQVRSRQTCLNRNNIALLFITYSSITLRDNVRSSNRKVRTGNP